MREQFMFADVNTKKYVFDKFLECLYNNQFVLCSQACYKLRQIYITIQTHL